ncbi:MAG TPA: PIN domain-containing protein, partial [Thermoleophilia bacterium]|nr:PIN domain-containing protein [Thermoleophilia bacterium]
IEALRPSGSRAARRLTYEAVDTGVAITNGLIRLELLAGARDQGMWDRLSDLLDAVVTVPTSAETWNLAARLGFALRRGGAAVPNTDLVIAASALEHEAALIHLDRHFEVIAGVSTLEQRFADVGAYSARRPQNSTSLRAMSGGSKSPPPIGTPVPG